MGRLMLDGKLPTNEELLTDDLVKQMIADARAEAIKQAEADAAKKKEEDDKKKKDDEEKDKAENEKKVKESILGSLTVEEVPETVKQKIEETAITKLTNVHPVVQGFLKEFIAAKTDGNGTVADSIDGVPVVKSVNQALRDNLNR